MQDPIDNTDGRSKAHEERKVPFSEPEAKFNYADVNEFVKAINQKETVLREWEVVIEEDGSTKHNLIKCRYY
jgi:hypothetical protein